MWGFLSKTDLNFKSRVNVGNLSRDNDLHQRLKLNNPKKVSSQKFNILLNIFKGSLFITSGITFINSSI